MGIGCWLAVQEVLLSQAPSHSTIHHIIYPGSRAQGGGAYRYHIENLRLRPSMHWNDPTTLPTLANLCTTTRLAFR